MRILRFVAALGGVLVGLGCSSSSATLASSPADTVTEVDAGPQRDGSAYDSSVSPTSGLGTLLFRPDHVYSGTDGTHMFQVPIAVYDADGDLVVTASDNAVTLTKSTLVNPVDANGVTDNGAYYLVTATTAGTYTLTATSKGRSVTAKVDITGYDAARYAAGAARYDATGTGVDRPCTTCHAGSSGVDHSPAALGTATDQEIGIIITTGVKPGPTVIHITSEPGTLHKWNVTDAEKDGLVTYLRGLTPRGFQ